MSGGGPLGEWLLAGATCLAYRNRIIAPSVSHSPLTPESSAGLHHTRRRPRSARSRQERDPSRIKFSFFHNGGRLRGFRAAYDLRRLPAVHTLPDKGDVGLRWGCLPLTRERKKTGGACSPENSNGRSRCVHLFTTAIIRHSTPISCTTL